MSLSKSIRSEQAELFMEKNYCLGNIYFLVLGGPTIGQASMFKQGARGRLLVHKQASGQKHLASYIEDMMNGGGV